MFALTLAEQLFGESVAREVAEFLVICFVNWILYTFTIGNNCIFRKVHILTGFVYCCQTFMWSACNP
jgi:hypothetical protein